MLKSISIRNLAIISSLQVDWTDGLNVLAGETGAGKSILFDALSIALGARANPSIIRAGCDKASIEVVFEPTSYVCAWLKKNELLDAEQTELIVTREITKTSSRARINGVIVNHAVLTELRSMLLTFHAQHEIRTLLSPGSQLELIDGLASKEHSKLKDKVRTLHGRYRDLRKQFADLSISESERERRLDFARYQLHEIRESGVRDPKEDEELKAQQKLLNNAQAIEKTLSETLTKLCGDYDRGFDNASARDLLADAINHLESLVELDRRLEEPLELLNTSLINLEEAAGRVRAHKDGADDFSHMALSEIEERLNILATIKRKYGPDLSSVIEREAELACEVDRLENASSQMSTIAEEIDELEAVLTEASEALSRHRKTLATTLSQSIIKELSALGMERCRFSIDFDRLEEVGQEGIDRVEFMIAPNPGQPMAPLSKIASGGELSRVMLAIKSIFAHSDKIPTVVFDEIDTGLGGKVLKTLRDKLVNLASSHQILCITHQPIVASVADNFIQVCKEQSHDNTVIKARSLNEEEKVNALATMASGREEEEVSLSFATSLVKEARTLKKTG
ncbi:MAG: DNA repair protein RecN [Cyanobacteria bacterium]|nr:DNA repair protein RecN [Cyanobacteriota bacterium]